MKNQELKLFVGGYYDERIFDGEQFDGKTPFDKNIETYTLSEVLELGFVESVNEWFEENYEKEWDQATEEEKVKAIIDYTDSDEIAGLVYFDTEEKAKEFKNDVIREVEDIEERSTYKGKRQDSYGSFREVYIEK